MKKIIALLLSLLILLSITGCIGVSKDDDINNIPNIVNMRNMDNEPTMGISPSIFTKETQDLLDLIGDETMFFDIILDESIKSFTIQTHIFENEKWNSYETMSSTIDHNDLILDSDKSIKNSLNRIGFGFTDVGFNFYEISNNGHSKFETESTIPDFSLFSSSSTETLDTNKTIVAGEEITLYSRIASNDNPWSTGHYNFRNSNCDAGYAVTVTFNDFDLN